MEVFECFVCSALDVMLAPLDMIPNGLPRTAVEVEVEVTIIVHVKPPVPSTGGASLKFVFCGMCCGGAAHFSHSMLVAHVINLS